MQYDEFVAQFKKAHHDWTFGRIDTAAAATELARLRSELPTIDPPEKRSDAEYSLNDFEAEISPAAQERMARAVAAIGAAGADGGTVDERIARAEEGLEEVTRIARESDDQNEQFAILSMNESLAMLISQLEHTRPTDGR